MNGADSLDKDIVDAAALVSILLVFVFAYFSAVLPQMEQLRSQPRPSPIDDRTALRARLFAFELIAAATSLITVGVFVVMLPLGVRALKTFSLGADLSTLRSGVVLVLALLVATAAALILEIVLLHRRRNELRKSI